MFEQIRLYMWSAICVVALVTGMPQRQQETDTALQYLGRKITYSPEIDRTNISIIINNYNNPSRRPFADSNYVIVNKPPPNNGDSQDCECVPVHLCGNNIKKEDEVSLIQPRNGNECSQRCCEETNTIQPTTATESKCGKRNINGIGAGERIFGNAKPAEVGEFPWMVAVVQRGSRNQNGQPGKEYRCGGSLIHPEVVLTAAHCVRNRSNLMVRAGIQRTQAVDKRYPKQDRNVREVIVHEQFEDVRLFNDLALLILQSPVDISFKNVGLICLPEANENMENQYCTSSGWGKDQFGRNGQYQDILKTVNMPIVKRGSCLEALCRTGLGRQFTLHPSFICAGGLPGKDTCTGDGGSPLVCPSKSDPEVYVQAGIVSWGVGCGTETPGVYVNVPAFVTWISNILEQYGISIF